MPLPGFSTVGTPCSLFIYCETPPVYVFVDYESKKREIKRRLIYEYRYDERLKTKKEESTRLSDTGLVVELEQLKTKTRLIDEITENISNPRFLFIFKSIKRELKTIPNM